MRLAGPSPRPLIMRDPCPAPWNMTHLLLNLRDVPEDEHIEIRNLLDEHGIGYYETEPNRWGISAGAIWVREPDQLDRARRLLDDYQARRRERVRSEREQALADGTEPGWSQLLRQPARLILLLLGIGLLLAFALWPLLLDGR